jgi:hypothetical protein
MKKTAKKMPDEIALIEVAGPLSPKTYQPSQ